MYNLADDYRGMMKVFKDTDVTKADSFIAMEKFYKELVAEGVSDEAACDLVSSAVKINTPVFITIKAFYNGLCKRGFTEEATVKLIKNMEIDVNQEFLDEGLLDETVEAYTKVLTDMKQGLDKISKNLFWQVITGGNKMTVKYYKETA